MSRRIFLAIMSLLIASASATAATNAIAADPNVFMNELWGRTVEVLGKNVPRTERLARFRQLFQADFDVPGIARFVLGRYWRRASEQEQQEYLKLFEDYVVFVYGTRLSSFNGETFKVRGSRTDDVEPSSRRISSARKARRRSKLIGGSSTTTVPSRLTT